MLNNVFNCIEKRFGKTMLQKAIPILSSSRAHGSYC